MGPNQIRIFYSFKRNLCWTVEEIEGMDTEDIMDYLFYFGIYFSREAFLNDLDKMGSIDSVVESWYQKFNIDVNDYLQYDFIKIAPGVLAKRFE